MSSYNIDLEKTSRILFPFYLMIIVLAPFPLGSNRPWAWALMSAVTFIVLFIYLFQYARAKIRPPELSIETKFICLLLIAWLAYQFLQLIPLPSETLGVLSPSSIELHSNVANELTGYASISIDSNTTGFELIKSSWYVVVFVLTLVLVQSKDRLRSLFVAVTITGVLQAVIGLTVAYLDQHSVRSSIDPAYYSQVTGTFINRNHFAGLINMSIASVIGLLLSVGIREKRKIHRDKFHHHWQSRLLDWRVYLLFYLCVMLMALVFSQSRGAWMGFAGMVTVIFFSMLALKINLKAFFVSNKLPILIIVFILLITGTDLLVNRLATLNDDLIARMHIWANSISIVKDFWLTGVGAGNYEYIYPLYDDGSIPAKVEHAHNDYLELLVEQGVIGFSILFFVIIICVKNSLKSLLCSQSIGNGAYSIASLMVIAGLMIHALFDFNFQIPSNVIYFFVFLAIALLQGAKAVRLEKRDIAWEEDLFNSPYNAKNSSKYPQL